MAATSANPVDPEASATASSDCTRESAPYAICTRSAGVGNHPLSGPPAVRSVGVNDDESSSAGSSSDPSPSTSDATASAAGICDPQACHIDRDFAHGRIAP